MPLVMRPDGGTSPIEGFKEHPRRLEWKMLFVDQPVLDQLPLPFFIEWEETEDVRFAKLRKDGIFSPANDDLEIKECVFRAKDPLKEILKWANLLSKKINDSNRIILPNVLVKFIPSNKNGKERLSDVIIQPIEKTNDIV